MSLNQSRKEIFRQNCETLLEDMKKIRNETSRVKKLASNSAEILDDLDNQFEKRTGLQKKDIPFLFTAIGLQIARIVIFNELTKIEKAGNGNRNEKALKNFQNKILNKKEVEKNYKKNPYPEDKLYYATIEHMILKGVPYDTTKSTVSGLFKGANHRFATLGHDPILGLIFGTANIMTNTITTVKKYGAFPIITTSHVTYELGYKNPVIENDFNIPCFTGVMFQKVFERIKDEPSAFVVALIKQIIHIGSDLYTTCGIQIPAANLILSNKEAEKLTKFIDTGTIIKAGTSALVSTLINFLISAVHTLMYNSELELSREIYNVRTRKIILYSNMIATGSNMLWVGANVLGGNTLSLKQLDIGGLLVILKRLKTDKEYIYQIKREFVLGEFDKKIKGEDLSLQELE